MCLIFIIGFFGSIAYSAYSWIFSNKLKVPKYDEISSITREGNDASGNKIDLAELDKKRHIEKKYGDDLSEILKTYKLPLTGEPDAGDPPVWF